MFANLNETKYYHMVRVRESPSSNPGTPTIGYTWFPLFKMVDWAYRKGRLTLDKYLVHRGLYDSAFDMEGVLRRQATPLVKHYQEHMARPMVPIAIV